MGTHIYWSEDTCSRDRAATGRLNTYIVEDVHSGLKTRVLETELQQAATERLNTYIVEEIYRVLKTHIVV
jgi:hypothetical protein